MARTMMLPVCGDTITLRPSLSPTSSLTEASISSHRSLRCEVVTRLDSGAADALLPLPPDDEDPPLALPLLPLLPEPDPDPEPAPAPPVIEPLSTRRSLRPLRLNEG